MLSKSDCLNIIYILLAGRAAEKIILGEEFSEAEADLEEATLLATQMVTKYGMGESLGIMVLSDTQVALAVKDFSSPVSIEIRKILNECYEKVERELKNNIKLIDKVAEALMQKGTISGDEFRDLIS